MSLHVLHFLALPSLWFVSFVPPNNLLQNGCVNDQIGHWNNFGPSRVSMGPVPCSQCCFLFFPLVFVQPRLPSCQTRGALFSKVVGPWRFEASLSSGLGFCAELTSARDVCTSNVHHQYVQSHFSNVSAPPGSVRPMSVRSVSVGPESVC